MKRLLIIGASVLQLPAIIKAKEMGLYVGVVDYNSQAVGIHYADEYYNASTMDEDAVLDAAKKFKPNGIMTLATDMPMRGVAKAAAALGLPGISYETAVRATDKHEMIMAFKASNVASPWFFTINSKESLKSIEHQLSYPCIMKPTDNAGSHGVVMALNFNELLQQFEYSQESSRHGNIIIEEYLQGDEVSVEIMVTDGMVNILQITDKLTTGAPHFVEMGHSQPSRHPVEIQEAIRKLAINACHAIGINVGPAHVEMMVTKRGPVMIELGARMGGDNITTALVPLSTGIDMVKATIDLALGNKADILPRFNNGAAIRYISAPVGRIKSISGIEEAKHINGVYDVIMTKTIGEMSTSINCSNDRIGSVIAQATSQDEAVKICEKAIHTIKIEIDE